MSMFSRLTDIINANLNALLEKAEDPVKIIRLLIQEMEDTLVELRSEAARAIAERKERNRHLQWLEQEMHQWDRRAELALSKEREELARAALAEKHALKRRHEATRLQLDQLDQNLERMAEDIRLLEEKLCDARNRQSLLSMREKTARARLKARSQLHNGRLQEVMQRFEAAERRLDRAEAEDEASTLGSRPELARAFDELEQQDQIQAELERLRKRVRGEGDE